MLIFGLHSTSDDQLDCLMDSNPIRHHSPAKKIKCSFWDDFQLLVIGRVGHGLKAHLPPLSSQKNKMLISGLHSTSDDQLGWSMDLNPICHPSPAKKRKCSFLDYIQLLMIGRLVDGLETHLPPFSTQKNKMLVLDYIQLLMISRTGQWT